MNNSKITLIASKVFVSISILSLLYVSLLSLYDPQATMALVQVELTNTDALSSIRGIYGGAGLAISISLIYLLINRIKWSLLFLSIFWGSYAFSRVLTIFMDGPLGEFGTQWLIIESVFSIISIALLFLYPKNTSSDFNS